MTTTIRRLKRRSEFLRIAALKKKWVAPGLIVQAAPTPRAASDGAPESGPRVGFTVSKKVGNAVRRNRAKRRLRAVAAQLVPECAAPDFDYVLIGRAATVTRPYDLLLQDFLVALKRLGAYRVAAGDAGGEEGRA